MSYQPNKIEHKWREVWDKLGLYKARDFSEKPKKYILVEFPYPSGSGLHVGHCRSYTALDIIARKSRMEGKNVLFPMGWDAFGLPTENYAVKTGIHPHKVTQQNTQRFRQQLKMLGFSFDWSREINTSDPGYYKWTQWIFIQAFKHGLAYKAKMDINWCPSCKITLANEEVVEGRCERCGEKVERKEKSQWLLKITEYADRLIEDLDQVDYPEKVKSLEKNWIGRSEGAEISFKVGKDCVKVFTTRPETIFGATYLVFSPEHPLVSKLKSKISNSDELENYAREAKRKTERERIAEGKEKTGVRLQGVKAKNPANNEEIPVFVADYVLSHYGTGVIMAVPGHDERDLGFAQKYNLPVVQVIEEEGKLINSDQFNGLNYEKGREKIIRWLKGEGIGEARVNYKLRDWIFSRQRYWGEPIPMIKCPRCGWVPVPEEDLPVELPEVENYRPTEEGDSPLAGATDWIKVSCPRCGGQAERETDVMPNWAGSNWYFLRYADSHNSEDVASKDLLKYWLPVDLYNGGMEHATLHLLYSRFIYKFLWDIGVVPESLGKEPYKKRTSHGTVLAEGGVKMSKSKGNVVNPEDIVKKYGADTMRVYEMFMGPFEGDVAWSSQGIKGVYRFLEKVWNIFEDISWDSRGEGPELKKLLHKTIKKVTEDINSFKFNTAVSALMVLTNHISKKQEISRSTAQTFLIILSPFAPYISEHLWWKVKGEKEISEYEKQDSIFSQKWPDYIPDLIKEEEVTLVVQVNGKPRDKIKVEKGISKEEAKNKALEREKIKKYIGNSLPQKIIFVEDKLINIVI